MIESVKTLYSYGIYGLNVIMLFKFLLLHGSLCFYFTQPDCCKKGMVLKRGSEGCHCVYPVKLDLLLLNVSQNPDWNIFLDELAALLGLRATQIELINFYVLGLSTLNISMYITPQKEISFSANEASKLNSSLLFHKVRLDSRFVGDYRVLNMTWFKPLPPSQGKYWLLIVIFKKTYSEMIITENM